MSIRYRRTCLLRHHHHKAESKKEEGHSLGARQDVSNAGDYLNWEVFKSGRKM